MDLTNKQTDDAMERVMAEESFAIKNSANNQPEYVLSRFSRSHGGEISERNWIKTRDGVSISGETHFRPVMDEKKRIIVDTRGNCGIIVKCIGLSNSVAAYYRIESDSYNGVWITEQVGSGAA